jgi:hypothetical protein
MFTRLFVLMSLVLGACAPMVDETGQARQALVDYFSHLEEGNYAAAQELYGGSYEILIGLNPSLDPDEHTALWRNACTLNGFQCLDVRNATFNELTGEGEYIFTVEFNNPDGTLFVLGPCCGATEAEMPPVSQFEYRVIEDADGNYVVLDLPVYVP